jgi:two-component system, OmpR family, phosphate regulon sensor histidine kinase PhoR
VSGQEYVLLVLLVLAAAFALFAWRRALHAQHEASQTAKELARTLAGHGDLGAELLQARSQLDAFGEAALDGLLLVDRNRRVLWGNAAAWEVFQSEQPAVGQAFIALAHDVELNQAVVDALNGGRSIVRQTAVDGRTLRIRAVPLPEGGGAAVAVEDVTELQRLGRARRDLIANISHELRTPLANIDLAAQTLRNGAAVSPELRERMLDQIQSYVQTLSQLSQEMMDLAQIESGQVLLKLVPVPVELLIERAAELLRPQAEVKRQALSLQVPPDLMVLADEQQVSRVIGNLIHNAIKFTPEEGKIAVEANAIDDEDVLVCVTDNGPGIPQADRERIFERFYKADRARSHGGTGLGLAIARHIVEGHGGRIWVESTAGQGARFCFTLPEA